MTRCCSAVPASTPTVAGRPTSAAYPASTSPRNAKTITPALAVIAIAEQRVAVATRSGRRNGQDEQRHGDDAPADPEERGEQPRGEPDGDEAHRRIVRAWPVGSFWWPSLLAVAGVAASGSAARTPPKGTAMYLVQHDKRLCPSPDCGGYWVALANGVRTRCGDGEAAGGCYVARTVDRYGRPFTRDIPEGALVRGAIELGLRLGDHVLDRLRVWAVYAPAGTATAEGGYYRVVDRGIRCIRAPCFSYNAGAVNAFLPVFVSEVDLQAAGAPAGQIDARSGRAAHEGRPLRTWTLRADPGRRAGLSGAAPLPQSAAASRLSTSHARRTSSSVVRKFPTARRSW